MPITAIKTEDEQSQLTTLLWHLQNTNKTHVSTAIICPKHKTLEQVANFLGTNGIAIKYTNQYDVFKSSHVLWILDIFQFCSSYNKTNTKNLDFLVYKIVSLDFFEISSITLFDISLQVSGSFIKHGASKSWMEIMLDYAPSTDKIDHTQVKKVEDAAIWLLDIATKSAQKSIFEMLDIIFGVANQFANEDKSEVEYEDNYEPGEV